MPCIPAHVSSSTCGCRSFTHCRLQVVDVFVMMGMPRAVDLKYSVLKAGPSRTPSRTPPIGDHQHKRASSQTPDAVPVNAETPFISPAMITTPLNSQLPMAQPPLQQPSPAASTPAPTTAVSLQQGPSPAGPAHQQQKQQSSSAAVAPMAVTDECRPSKRRAPEAKSSDLQPTTNLLRANQSDRHPGPSASLSADAQPPVVTLTPPSPPPTQPLQPPQRPSSGKGKRGMEHQAADSLPSQSRAQSNVQPARAPATGVAASTAAAAKPAPKRIVPQALTSSNNRRPELQSAAEPLRAPPPAASAVVPPSSAPLVPQQASVPTVGEIRVLPAQLGPPESAVPAAEAPPAVTPSTAAPPLPSPVPPLPPAEAFSQPAAAGAGHAAPQAATSAGAAVEAPTASGMSRGNLLAVLPADLGSTQPSTQQATPAVAEGSAAAPLHLTIPWQVLAALQSGHSLDATAWQQMLKLPPPAAVPAAPTSAQAPVPIPVPTSVPTSVPAPVTAPAPASAAAPVVAETPFKSHAVTTTPLNSQLQVARPPQQQPSPAASTPAPTLTPASAPSVSEAAALPAAPARERPLFAATVSAIPASLPSILTSAAANTVRLGCSAGAVGSANQGTGAAAAATAPLQASLPLPLLNMQQSAALLGGMMSTGAGAFAASPSRPPAVNTNPALVAAVQAALQRSMPAPTTSHTAPPPPPPQFAHAAPFVNPTVRPTLQPPSTTTQPPPLHSAATPLHSPSTSLHMAASQPAIPADEPLRTPQKSLALPIPPQRSETSRANAAVLPLPVHESLEVPASSRPARSKRQRRQYAMQQQPSPGSSEDEGASDEEQKRFERLVEHELSKTRLMSVFSARAVLSQAQDPAGALCKRRHGDYGPWVLARRRSRDTSCIDEVPHALGYADGHGPQSLQPRQRSSPKRGQLWESAPASAEPTSLPPAAVTAAPAPSGVSAAAGAPAPAPSSVGTAAASCLPAPLPLSASLPVAPVDPAAALWANLPAALALQGASLSLTAAATSDGLTLPLFLNSAIPTAVRGSESAAGLLAGSTGPFSTAEALLSAPVQQSVQDLLRGAIAAAPQGAAASAIAARAQPGAAVVSTGALPLFDHPAPAPPPNNSLQRSGIAGPSSAAAAAAQGPMAAVPQLAATPGPGSSIRPALASPTSRKGSALQPPATAPAAQTAAGPAGTALPPPSQRQRQPAAGKAAASASKAVQRAATAPPQPAAPQRGKAPPAAAAPVLCGKGAALAQAAPAADDSSRLSAASAPEGSNTPQRAAAPSSVVPSSAGRRTRSVTQALMAADTEGTAAGEPRQRGKDAAINGAATPQRGVKRPAAQTATPGARRQVTFNEARTDLASRARDSLALSLSCAGSQPPPAQNLLASAGDTTLHRLLVDIAGETQGPTDVAPGTTGGAQSAAERAASASDSGPMDFSNLFQLVGPKQSSNSGGSLKSREVVQAHQSLTTAVSGAVIGSANALQLGVSATEAAPAKGSGKAKAKGGGGKKAAKKAGQPSEAPPAAAPSRRSSRSRGPSNPLQVTASKMDDLVQGLNFQNFRSGVTRLAAGAQDTQDQLLDLGSFIGGEASWMAGAGSAGGAGQQPQQQPPQQGGSASRAFAKLFPDR